MNTNMNMTVEEIINFLNLEKHPEGGYYREVYRSELKLSGIEGFCGSRNCATSIYFLLTKDSRSHLHRIKSDEIWHFYSGDPLRIVMLDNQGKYSEVLLGSNLKNGQSFQFVVPAGVWFGAEVINGGNFSLVGCNVSPGFDFDDFELASKGQLLELHPHHQEFISTFCID